MSFYDGDRQLRWRSDLLASLRSYLDFFLHVRQGGKLGRQTTSHPSHLATSNLLQWPLIRVEKQRGQSDENACHPSDSENSKPLGWDLVSWNWASHRGSPFPCYPLNSPSFPMSYSPFSMTFPHQTIQAVRIALVHKYAPSQTGTLTNIHLVIVIHVCQRYSQSRAWPYTYYIYWSLHLTSHYYRIM